jgi:hypothetical protein
MSELPTPPIAWIAPEDFDKDAPGLNLPQLEGISHQLLYNPQSSRANVDEGGDGRYESVEHGTFCHGPNYVILGDYIIAAWSNHTRDECGPGSRKISRVGKIVRGGDDIDWGGQERLSVIGVPPIAPRRRTFTSDPELLGPYIGAGIQLIGDRLYVQGSMASAIGFTNREECRLTDGPVPEDNFRDNMDIESGFNFDKWAPLGFSFVQRLRIENDRLVFDSPLYQMSEFRSKFEVTPGRFKVSPDLLPPYADAVPFSEAPDEIKRDILDNVPVSYKRTPKFAPDTKHLAVDGLDALAHASEFRRPDDSWVVVRDNLLNPGYYYASEKATEEDVYPPGQITSLYAGANPAAGELPDGRPFIICSSYDDYYLAADKSRQDMYITLSHDGRTFDRTWLLMHDVGEPDGGMYKFGGPQYFNPVILGENMWIFYSITKQKIGITKVPLSLLTT